MSNPTWFDDYRKAEKDAKTQPRILPFRTQAVRNFPHRRELPDVYKRPADEACDVMYLLPHLSPPQGSVDAPVPIYRGSYRDSEVPYDRLCVSDVMPDQEDMY